tara:strand:+ start:686 stop:1033 length:348 start_codon:yes stop_codon:yes gene_type:complete
MYFIIKTIVTALIIVLVSEIAKKYTWTAAVIVSIPLTSLLAFIWLYYDTRDVQKVIDLSLGTIVMTIPSILFFILLPIMLKLKQNFTFSIVVAVLSTSLAYFFFIILIKKINFNF